MVLLVGLAPQNGILIVEFANQLRDEGKDAREAVQEAVAARLRPILITSVATVLGAMPLAVASGAGSEARVILDLVTAGGLTLGTMLTLFVVPALYVLASGCAAAPAAVDGELRELEQKHPEAGTAPTRLSHQQWRPSPFCGPGHWRRVCQPTKPGVTLESHANDGYCASLRL